MTTVAEPTLTVGYGIQSRGEFDSLPDGTVLRYEGGVTSRFEKRDGQWITEAGRVYNPNFFTLRGQNVIESLPTPGMMTDAARLPGVRIQTLDQFKQRFRTTTYGVQQRSGVSSRPLDVAMGKLSVPDYEPSIGMWVFGADNRLLARLPDRTILVNGHPNDAVGHGVVGWAGGFVQALFGITDTYGNTFRILSGPGLEEAEWVKAEGTLESAAEILAFKREAWRLGLQAKQENSWCGEYESAMNYVGITERILDDETPLLLPEEVAALPLGSIVRFTCNMGSALFRREEGADNPAGTKGLCGLRADWSSHPVRVVHNPERDQHMFIKIETLHEMNTAPVGTGMSETRGRTQWTSLGVLDGNQQVTWRTGSNGRAYLSGQFGIGTLSFSEFPVETTAAVAEEVF